jgi:hypothetical protein
MNPYRLKLLTKLLSYKMGYKLEKLAPTDDVLKFIHRFSEMYVNTNLVRAGMEGDGGYLVPPVLDTCEACFSPGVGPTVDFEKWIIEHHPMPCFLADASVSQPPFAHDLIDFERKFVGSNNSNDYVRMKSWVDEKTSTNSQNLLLQMDIEGGEYAVLSRESASFWKRFNVMVIEFHFLENLFDRFFLQMLSSTFERLYENFRIVHIHPNNADMELNIRGIKVPRVMEITFLNTALLDNQLLNAPITLPNSLDMRNVPNSDDIVVDPIWYK